MKQKKLNSWSSKNSKHTHILFYLVATLIEPPKNGVAAAYRVKIHFHSGTIWIPWGLSLVLFLLPPYLHFLLLMPPKNVWQEDNAVQFVSSSWILQDKLNRSIYHRCTSSTLCQTCRLKLTPHPSPLVCSNLLATIQCYFLVMRQKMKECCHIMSGRRGFRLTMG